MIETTNPYNQSNKEYVISLIQSQVDTLSPSDSDYANLLLNQIVRLRPQPKDPITGHSMRYSTAYVRNKVHCSLVPKMYLRYQYFLLNEYNGGGHSNEVNTLLDKLLNKTYKKIGKLYVNLNKRYSAIAEYKKGLEINNNK
jgi:hypothetical protein